MPKKLGLGRGLSSLIPRKIQKQQKSSGQSSDGNRITMVETGLVRPNPFQPRTNFDANYLEELVASIKEHGILQPLIVTKEKDGYELIAGERRLRAAKSLRLPKVPVIIRKADNLQKLEVSLVENIQRNDLNPMEKAISYQRLVSEFGLTYEQIEKKTGKNKTTIVNTIRLLKLPKEIQNGLTRGKITEGHARAILSVQSPEKQRALYREILNSKISVRGTESKARMVSVRRHIRRIEKLPEIKSLEEQLQGALGTKVDIDSKGKGGKISIDYYSKEELDNISKIILS